MHTYADEVSTQIGYLIKDPLFCTAHFSNIQVPVSLPAKSVSQEIEFRQLKDDKLSDKNILKAGDTVDQKIEITAIRLNIDSMPEKQRYLGSISLSFKEINSTKTLERSIPFMALADDNRNITYCGRLKKKDYREESVKEYSADCSDYSIKGWPTKDDCMKDGRWHIVFQQKAGQHLPISYKNEFLKHISKGAEARVGIRDSNGIVTAYENCNHISTNDVEFPNMILCLTGARAGVNNWETHNSQNLRGGVVFFNDGSAHAPGWGSVRNMGLVWYIKY